MLGFSKNTPVLTRRRSAFSLIELLVVISIISVLVALLLPAFFQAREATRDVVCKSHLRQNGLAILGYVNAKSFLPPGYEFSIKKDKSIGNNGAVVNGFFTLILPYLDEDVTESRYDYINGYDHARNQSVVKLLVPTFQCPSTPLSRMMKIRNNLASFAGGNPDQGHYGQATDYFGVRVFIDKETRRSKGVFRAIFPDLPGFEQDSPLNLSQISDGATHTAMLVEIAGRPMRYAKGQRLGIQDYYAGTWAGINGEMLYAIDPKIKIAPSAGDCVINCNNFYTPYSFHSRFINVLRCDGSVTAVSEEIDPEVWQQFLQPDDHRLLLNRP